MVDRPGLGLAPASMTRFPKRPRVGIDPAFTQSMMTEVELSSTLYEVASAMQGRLRELVAEENHA